MAEQAHSETRSKVSQTPVTAEHNWWCLEEMNWGSGRDATYLQTSTTQIELSSSCIDTVNISLLLVYRFLWTFPRPHIIDLKLVLFALRKASLFFHSSCPTPSFFHTANRPGSPSLIYWEINLHVLYSGLKGSRNPEFHGRMNKIQGNINSSPPPVKTLQIRSWSKMHSPFMIKNLTPNIWPTWPTKITQWEKKSSTANGWSQTTLKTRCQRVYVLFYSMLMTWLFLFLAVRKKMDNCPLLKNKMTQEWRVGAKVHLGSSLFPHAALGTWSACSCYCTSNFWISDAAPLWLLNSMCQMQLHLLCGLMKEESNHSSYTACLPP